MAPIPGSAIALATAGGLLIYAGLHKQTVLAALRDVAAGKPQTLPKPVPNPFGEGTAAGAGPTVAGSGLGARIAANALRYQGVRYVWGGADPSGWDCSGFVTWVLHHDCGINLPSNVHTVTGQFYVWSGASTIPRAAMAAGDLVCWTTHIGIALDGTRMIHAPDIGQPTQISNVWSIPTPLIRRVMVGP